MDFVSPWTLFCDQNVDLISQCSKYSSQKCVENLIEIREVTEIRLEIVLNNQEK